MMVSITRLHIRSPWFLPRFIWLNEKVVGQIRTAPGFQSGRLVGDLGLSFWTLTLWDEVASMRAFRDTGAHRHVMPKLIYWCDEASVAQWPDRPDLPSWTEAHAWMKEHGRPNKVRHPSPRHATLDIPPPRSNASRPISPKAK
jgi:hypothetical protein